MSDLAEVQRFVQDVITNPDGVDAGLERAAAGAGPISAETVIRESAALSAREGLMLYSATYHRRLTGCLRDSYPGLRHMLGDELFDDFALDYLRAQPSRSYTLSALGAAWPTHLEATRPDHDLPPERRERWPDLLVDVARLERAFCEVYDGPGMEGRPLPAIPPFSASGDGEWDRAVVTPAVCLRLLHLRFPIGGYLVAVRRGEDPELPAPAESFIALSRRDYVVTMTELDATAHVLLSGLIAGTPVAVAARRSGLALHKAWRLLRDWVHRGLFAAFEVPQPDSPAIHSTGGAVARC